MLLAGFVMSAQDARELVTRIRTEAAESCVTAEYSMYAVVDEVRIEDEGTVVAQGDSWYLKGQSLEIYTCEQGTWILQPESKEAIVEPKWTYDDLDLFYSSLLKEAGNGLSVKINSFRKSEGVSPSFFTPNLDDEWIVTDLR